MDASKEFNALIGAKIHFKTYDGEYEGVIKSISSETKRLTIEHMECLPERVYVGNSVLFFYEFLTYSILDSCKKVPEIREKQYLSPILKRNCSEDNCRTNVLFNELGRKLKFEEGVVYEEPNFKKEFVLKLPSNLLGTLPNDSVILNDFDLELQKAIDYIRRQSVIGVSFEGPKISRNGKLAWVSISTDRCVFLFDVGTLGKSVFDNVLRNIFQNQNIMKVIHDCRQPSDCLFHLFSTTLVNVFDTQVADFIVNKQRCRDKSSFKYLSSLDCCLINYLAVPKEFLYNRNKYSSYSDEVNYFRKRPIDNECRNILIKNSLYLILLKEKLTKLMMNPVFEIGNIYLNAIAQSSESDLTLEPSVPHMIPRTLLAQGIQVISYQKNQVKTSAPHPLELKHQKENTGENKFSNVDSNKTITKRVWSKKFDKNCLDNSETFSNKKVAEKNKCKSKTKWSTNVVSQKASDNTGNDFVQNYSVAHRKFNNKMHINDEFNKSLNSISSAESSGHAVAKAPNNLMSNFDVHGSQLKKSSIEGEVSVNEFYAEGDTSCKSNIQKGSIGLNECSSDSTNDSISDYSDTWAKLRLAFGVSPDVSSKPVTKSNKNIRIVPSGMCC